MRKIVIGAFVSLDGIMQGPGGPEEDPTGGFVHGGWVAPLFDDVVGAAMGELFSQPYELLLGRKTYDIFAAHWPDAENGPDAEIAKQFNAIRKHVATHRPESLNWKNSHGLGADVVSALRSLKKSDGPTLLTQGSTELVHLLLANDLADELAVLTFPVLLGKGKRLFDEGSRPGALRLAKSVVSPSGVLVARYERAGDVRTGSFALAEPTPAEVERRRNLE
jgi:dihydrofolate reductase